MVVLFFLNRFLLNLTFVLAYNIAEVSTRFLKCKAEVVNKGLPAPPELIKLLLTNHTFLVPYDCDKNHQPCCNNGASAHWSLICGFLVFINSCDLPPSLSSNGFERDAELPYLYYLCKDNASNLDLNSLKSITDENFFVLALHGKSRHVAIWPYKSLQSSNAQLREVGSQRLSESDRYILPEHGLSDVLGNHVVVLSM